jgi:hypothetical protein
MSRVIDASKGLPFSGFRLFVRDIIINGVYFISTSGTIQAGAWWAKRP